MEVACYPVEVMMVFGEEVGVVLKGEDLALNGLVVAVVVVLTLEWDNRRLVEVVGDYAILAHLVEVEGFHIDAMVVVVVECKVDDLVVVVAAVMCNGSDDLVMVAVVVEFGHSHDLMVVVVVVEFDRSHGLVVVVVVEVQCDRSNDLVVAVVVKCDHNDDLVMEAHMQLVVVVVVVRQVDR